MVPLLRKTRLFRITFRWTALKSEQLCHILLHGTIEWLIRTTGKLHRFKLVQHHCRKSRYSHYGTVTNYRTLAHHIDTIGTVGLYTEWEDSIKPVPHGPTLTADTNDWHWQPTLSIDILTAECRHLRRTKLRATASDVDVDRVYKRRPRPLCPPHLITLQFNYMLRFFI